MPIVTIDCQVHIGKTFLRHEVWRFTAQEVSDRRLMAEYGGFLLHNAAREYAEQCEAAHA